MAGRLELEPYTDAELAGVGPMRSVLEARGEWGLVDGLMVEADERRYDLGDGAGILGLFDRHDNDSAVALVGLAAKWFVRSRLPLSNGDGLFSVTGPLLDQCERITDEEGTECWVRRES
jgi:hypothetical protein